MLFDFYNALINNGSSKYYNVIEVLFFFFFLFRICIYIFVNARQHGFDGSIDNGNYQTTMGTRLIVEILGDN